MIGATVFDWLYHAARWTWHDPDGYNFISGPLADITLIGAGTRSFGATTVTQRAACASGVTPSPERRTSSAASTIQMKARPPRRFSPHMRRIGGALQEVRATASAAVRDVTEAAHDVAADVHEVAEDIHEAEQREGPPEA